MKSARESIDALVEIEAIKVWSLIVTLFGDLALSGTPTLSGVQIRTLLGHVGMKPEAIRVALHRLKKDGWIETSKSGRVTQYSLSKTGISETRAATGDIYRRTVKYGSGWKLELCAEEDEDKSAPGISVFRNVVMTPNDVSDHDLERMELEFDRTKVPSWFADRIVSSDVEVTAAKLSSTIEGIKPGLSQFHQLDQAALRLLVLHHWRKMALRSSTWFHIWLFDEGTISKCHRNVVSILSDSPRLDPRQFNRVV